MAQDPEGYPQVVEENRKTEWQEVRLVECMGMQSKSVWRFEKQ